jgi:hypothetical protein
MLREVETPREFVPRPRKIIEEHLRDVLELKTLAMEIGKNDFVGRIRMKNILRQEALLHEELCAAKMLESDDDMEFEVDGEPIQGSMIAVDFFGEFLRDVQELANQVMFYADMLSRTLKTAPENVLAESRIMFAGMHSSIFTIQLRLTPLEHLDDLFAPERRKAALLDLHMLFDEKTSDQDLVDLITRSASKTSYRKFLKNISDKRAVIRFRTKVNPYGVLLTPEMAACRIGWMDVSEEKPNEIIDVTGYLTGGNIDTNRFRLQVEGLGLITGVVAKEAQGQMRIKLGSLVRARIERKIKHKTRSDPEPTISYALQNIYVIKDKEETLSLFDKDQS